MKQKRGRASCQFKNAEPFNGTGLGAFGWGSPNKEPNYSKIKVTPSPAELRTASFMLAVAGSFCSDEKMFEILAHRGKLEFCKEFSSIPGCMPVEHIVDHHNFRGIGHVLEGASSYSEKFLHLFKSVTGVNPRKTAIAKEFEKNIEKVRSAQRLCLLLAVGDPTAYATTGQVRDMHFAIDAGVLSAAVGPIEVKSSKASKKLLVTLGIVEPEDEVVMRKPSRGTLDLYSTITTQERKIAIEEIRSLPLRLESPFPIGRIAEFDQVRQQWCIKGIPWADVCSEGLHLQVSVHPKVQQILSDEALVVAASHVGAGVTEEAENNLALLCSKVSITVLLRALSLVRQQYSAVHMPVPGIEGGKASDE